MRSLAATAAAAVLMLASPALALTLDLAALRHDIFDPVDSNGDPVEYDGNPTYYQLAGQSAFIQTRANSGTSGGQLDGATGTGFIQFTEVFPPALLGDYLTFSYIGVVELQGTDVNGDPILLDQSIVIAFRPGTIAAGTRIEDLFPSYTESALVTAFTTQFDSPEFLDMAFTQVGGQPDTSGLIHTLTSDCHNQNTVACDTPITQQAGEYLDLIAFIGGTNGDEGVAIGTLDFSVTRVFNLVPEPAPMAMFAVGVVGLAIAGCVRRTQS
jgi:hypothetical protein